MTVGQQLHRTVSALALLSLLAAPFASAPTPVRAAPPAVASTVALVGSLQSEVGCAGDWDPACAASYLTYDAADDVWQATFTLPAGAWEYKVALNNGWDENYGANAAPSGANIALNLAAETVVKFYYDDKTHWITSNVNHMIAVAPGSFQSELGCPGDWQPDCLRSWLQDIDDDGVYTFATTAIPAGAYEGKVALNESWDVNYGAGGVQGGDNILFTVPASGATVTFAFDSATNTPTIEVVPLVPTDDVQWDGLRHDSRDPLYRTPGGAVPTGTPVTVRFRTFHGDVTGVQLRVYDVDTAAQTLLPMTPAATDVGCYQAGLEDRTCDFWAVTLPNDSPANVWYRFVVADGTDVDYYGDNTTALDGGLGAPSDDPIDNSYALMVHDPAFTSPSWAQDAVIYQIFPDRFRNGDPRNDPDTGDPRYDDPMIALDWGTLPEGYCRNYADRDENCPWRFDDTPPDTSPTVESPRGRDYYGGDLRGVLQRLPYLRSMGVTVIYFNPIFTARSNHRYDTADYYEIDPALGTLNDWKALERAARLLGMRIVVDGVFNHLSSDSAFFDRYQAYDIVGACESAGSEFRPWFTFRPPSASEPAPCVPSTPGGADTYYSGWFGFDSIPVINKSLPEVVDYFVTGDDSVSKYWLEQGADGWRLDVMGDASFPAGYWEEFRSVVKAESADAVIIGELWQKDSTLLRFLRGDRADTTMNYRLRDAVLGLLTPNASFDGKGFGDSGRQITPTEFANRILAIREDYPDAAYYSLMNLLDSHDTERLLWTLTAGAETQAEREFNAANLAAGKQRVKLASLIQFTLPGAPTVYYGDEVGVTGDDDPDDRRTYPWADKGGKPDTQLFAHYASLGWLREFFPALATGDLRMLLVDDANNTLAYGRQLNNQGAVIVLNRGDVEQTITVPVAGFLPERTRLTQVYSLSGGLLRQYRVSSGALSVTVPALGGMILVTNGADLTPTAAPTGLTATASTSQVNLAWNAVPRAGGYNVYRSPLTGGGFVKLNGAPLTGLTYTDTGLRNGRDYYYVVRALDSVGNESAASPEASAMPTYTIGWANLQWPPSVDHTVSVVNRTPDFYGQVWIDGVTNQPGVADTLIAEVGYGPVGSDPAGAGWLWSPAVFNIDNGNNDEFKGSFLPDIVGSYDVVYRYSTSAGRSWLYADLGGPVAAGALPAQPGRLNVLADADTVPPAAPTGLRVDSASPAGIVLAWDAVVGDASLYGYEVRRSSAGGASETVALVTAAAFTDLDVQQGVAYTYTVRAVDLAYNRSGESAPVTATAELRTVTVVFTVTVPDTTDASGRVVNIAGTLNRLDGGLPEWNPSGAALTRIDATTWQMTLTGKESTQIEYKYALGSWDYVEKDAACGEIGNRQLTLSYGASGTQNVNDVVGNWRNSANFGGVCGN
ncbi:MAG TPA: alpha-amylase family glycosyl hydrolase [Anaerolineales bacterium]|nr:alpha-amylase family glycosyl hydrolase [Anaerolineales bacterium]